MKKIVLLLAIIFSANSFGMVLKKVNIPENWKIESSEEQKDFNLEGILVAKYIKQAISTPQGTLTVHYYFCDSMDLANKAVKNYFGKKQPAYQDGKMVYFLEGDVNDIKNTLRFVQLPLTEQVKLNFPDIANIQNTELKNEEVLKQEEVQDNAKRFGIQMKDGLKQLYVFSNSKAKLSVKYFRCKNKEEARIGYSNARIRNKNDLASYAFSEEYLAEMEWVK